MSYAPDAFKTARRGVLEEVFQTFQLTQDLRLITLESILTQPKIISVLRMVTAPPLAQDRLVGLSYTNKSLLKNLEQGRTPKDSNNPSVLASINRMLNTINQMLDKELFPWLNTSKITPQQRNRSAAIIADRLTGMLSDPIIRNAQERRQFNAISEYLDSKGYVLNQKVDNFEEMRPKTYSFHVNIPVKVGQTKIVNMPIDVAIKSKNDTKYPLLVECKSAGDFTNTNKRRKEEAIKITQLRDTYGDSISFCLFLCGYFDPGYLGYEAAERIDWVWEHRINDFDKLGL